MCEMGGMDEDTAAEMISFAEYEAEEMEREGKPGKVREPVAVPQTQGPAPLGRPAPADQPSEARQAFENLFSGAPGETTEEMPVPAEGTESGERVQGLVEAPPIEPPAAPATSEEPEAHATPLAVEPVAEPVAAAAEPPAQPQGSESPPPAVE